MTHLPRKLAAIATAMLITASGSAAANAMETSPTLPPADRPYHEVTDQPVYSPYGKTVHCLFTRDYISRGTCYQQRPDGQWVHMVNMDPAFVYPVWEDPEALVASLPQGAQGEIAKINAIVQFAFSPGPGHEVLSSPAVLDLLSTPGPEFVKPTTH